MSETPKDSDQMTLLMQYTSSHMQIFIGVIAGVASAYKFLAPHNKSTLTCFVAASFFFVFAGTAIGIIASYLPHFRNYEEFAIKGESVKNNKVIRLPFKLKYVLLEKAQNYGFWLGVVASIVALVLSTFGPVKTVQ